MPPSLTAMKEISDDSKVKIRFWTPLKKISSSTYIDGKGIAHDSSDTTPFFDLPVVSGYDTWEAYRTLTGYGTALNYRLYKCSTLNVGEIVKASRRIENLNRFF